MRLWSALPCFAYACLASAASTALRSRFVSQESYQVQGLLGLELRNLEASDHFWHRRNSNDVSISTEPSGKATHFWPRSASKLLGRSLQKRGNCAGKRCSPQANQGANSPQSSRPSTPPSSQSSPHTPGTNTAGSQPGTPRHSPQRAGSQSPPSSPRNQGPGSAAAGTQAHSAGGFPPRNQRSGSPAARSQSPSQSYPAGEASPRNRPARSLASRPSQLTGLSNAGASSSSNPRPGSPFPRSRSEIVPAAGSSRQRSQAPPSPFLSSSIGRGNTETSPGGMSQVHVRHRLNIMAASAAEEFPVALKPSPHQPLSVPHGTFGDRYARNTQIPAGRPVHRTARQSAIPMADRQPLDAASRASSGANSVGPRRTSIDNSEANTPTSESPNRTPPVSGDRSSSIGKPPKSGESSSTNPSKPSGS